MIQTTESLADRVGISSACEALQVPRSSLYRLRPKRQQPSRESESKGSSEGSASTRRATPVRALSPEERIEVREVLNSERFQDRSPRQVWAALLDEGRYLCSVRTMYRILEEHGEVRERRNQLQHPSYTKPELLARRPNELWSWDITKLKGPAKWAYFYLYVILDVFSRYVVGWMIAERESDRLARELIEVSCRRQGITPDQLTLHSDRGPSMKSKTVAELLSDLGVEKTHSRPHVSNDNPYSEAQFRTMKYRPDFPERFGSLMDARSWGREFFLWYNEEHYHSGLGLLTPQMVHYGAAETVQSSRQQVLHTAYAVHPERFVRGVPSVLELPKAVWINKPAEAKELLGEAEELLADVQGSNSRIEQARY